MNMPLVSVNILTKNRASLLQKALASVCSQSFSDYEIVLVDDGSTDETPSVIERFKDLEIQRLNVIHHNQSTGITASRQEALLASRGKYVAILDDDDEWTEKDKLKKQAEYLDQHPEVVLVGGGIKIELGIRNYEFRMRPEQDQQIRKTMLFRNNFFTSTVMFRREAAIRAGAFLKDQDDFAEDYDLWLRMGKSGKMHNFSEVFASYSQPGYNKERFRAFLKKQLRLIKQSRRQYPFFLPASALLKLRILL